MKLLLLPLRLIFSSFAIRLYLIAIVAAFLWVTHKKVMTYLCTVEKFMVEPNNVDLSNLPSWADDRMRTEIQSSFPYRRRFTIFSPDIEERLVEAYRDNPWVLRVKGFRKELPDRILFSLVLRRPAVTVQYKGIYYIVSRDGIVLPRTYPEPPSFGKRLYILAGVPTPPAEFGARWEDEALSAGVSVALALEKYAVRNLVDVRTIDVSNVRGRLAPQLSEIVLWTGVGVPILWGRAPSTRMYGELPVEKKIENLRAVLEFSPDLYGLEYAKIQFDRPYVRLKGYGT